MTITRANVETILVKRVGPLLTKAGMATTIVGSNADLNDPMGYALRQAGYSVASILSVSDSDLASVSDSGVDEVIDFAEYMTLENILGNLDDVNTTLGPRKEELFQLTGQVERKLARLEKKLNQLYGWNASTLETGVIIQEFAEHGD